MDRISSRTLRNPFPLLARAVGTGCFAPLLSIFLTFPLPAFSAADIDLSSGYFGNRAVVESVSQIPLTTVGTNPVRVSVRFYQAQDDSISSVAFHGQKIGSASFSINIYSDVNGLPGTVVGGDNANMMTGWTNPGFLSPVDVKANTIYHVVLEGGGDANNYYAVDGYSSPLHGIFPLSQTGDEESNATVDWGDGSGFQSLDQQPIFVIEYSDSSTYAGNPYAATNPVAVYGTSAAGEVFLAPTSSPWVSRVGAYLRYASPAGALQYRLEDLTASVTLSTGTLAAGASGVTGFAWVDAALSGGPVQLTGGHRCRLSFFSPSSNSSAFYLLDNPTNPDSAAHYDGLTFDGTDAYTVVSSDGGASFPVSTTAADLAFRLQISAAPTATFTPTKSATPTRTATTTWTVTATPTITPTPVNTATPADTFTPNPQWTPPCAPNSGTFGNNTTGVSDSGASDDTLWATRYTLSEAATITSMAVRLNCRYPNNPVVETALYTDNAGSPGNLIVSAPSQTLFAGWNYLTIPATLLSPGVYWLAYQANSGGAIDRRSTYPTADDTVFYYMTYGAFPGTFPSGSYPMGEQLCIYAAYCPVATYTPVATATPTSTRTPTTAPTATKTATGIPSPTWTLTPVPTLVCVSYFDLGNATPADTPHPFEDLLVSSPFLATGSGFAVTLSVRCTGADGTGMIVGGIYADDGTGKPGVLLGTTAPQVAVAGWNNLVLPNIPIVQGTTYWLAATSDSSQVLIDGVGSGQGTNAVQPWLGACPATFGSAQNPNTLSYVLYAQIGEVATATATPSPTSTWTETPTWTATATSTGTPTFSPSPTPTVTATWSLTPPPVPTSVYCAGFGAAYTGSYEGPTSGTSTRGAKYTLSAAAAVTAVEFYLDLSGTANNSLVRAAIYQHSSASSGPHQLVAQSGYLPNLLHAGWNTIPVTMAVLPPGDYWICASVALGTTSYGWWGMQGESGGVSVTVDWSAGAPVTFDVTTEPSDFHYDFHALCGPMPTDTPTATPSTTPTPVPTVTWTASATATDTNVPPTETSTPTGTFTPTATQTATWTASATATDTSVPPAETSTSTGTFTPTASATATDTPVPPTETSTPSETPFASPTPDGRTLLSKNVFRPEEGPLWIDYQGVSAGWMRVRVLNVAGETVADLVSEQGDTAPHRVAWDGRNGQGHQVGSGLYVVWIHGEGLDRFLKVLVRR